MENGPSTSPSYTFFCASGLRWILLKKPQSTVPHTFLSKKVPISLLFRSQMPLFSQSVKRKRGLTVYRFIYREILFDSNRDTQYFCTLLIGVRPSRGRGAMLD